MRSKELTDEQREDAKKAFTRKKFAYRPPDELRDKLKIYSKQTGNTQNDILTIALRQFFKGKTIMGL